MSIYTVQKNRDGVSVTCDGEPVTLVPVLGMAHPTFDYGTRSDSAMNLAYAILRHCAGDGEAELLCMEFVNRFLLRADERFEIQSKDIQEYVALLSRTQYLAQEAVKNMKRFPA